MKKVFTVLFSVFLLSVVNVYAVDAEITYVKGKVEVQRGNEWVALKAGDKVAKSEMISTGFQSEAKIKLLDSIMDLGPVTRITLEELSAGKSQDKVNVYLKTGSVRSQVNHIDSKRVNYQVHTAIAVASARGTNFAVFDSNEVAVIEGIVALEEYKAPVSGTTSNEVEAKEAEAVETENAENETVENETVVADAAETEQNLESTTGVLVKENESAVMTDSKSIDQPVNVVVQSISAVVNAVTTAAEKESVTSVVTTPASIVNKTVSPTAPVVESVKNGTIIISIDIE